MLARNSVIMLIFLFFSLQIVEAQTSTQLNLSVGKNTRLFYGQKPQQENEMVTFETGKNFSLFKVSTTASSEAVIYVDTFFNKQVEKGLGKLQFEMTPLPTFFYQSENKNIQLIWLTTGSKTGALFRYSF